MTELYRTTGRPMTGALQRALDGLTAIERKVAIRVLYEADSGSMLAPLYRALVLELQLAGMLEQETDRQFREMTQAAIPEPPLPPATGPAMQLDPETGQFVEIPAEDGPDRS